MIKNPQPVAFVRQANIAHGSQQVNNAFVQREEHAFAEKTRDQQHKSLESLNDKRLDNGAENQQATLIQTGNHDVIAGPRRVAGKASVSQNTYKGRHAAFTAKIARLLYKQKQST